MYVTTEPLRVITSGVVTHNVNSDVKTSTSVSEQTTRLPNVVQDKSTRLDIQLSTNKGFQYPRTTRSIEGSETSEIHLQVESSQNNVKKTFIVSLFDAWPTAVTQGLGQVTGLAVNSAGRLLVFHRSERTWEYE